MYFLIIESLVIGAFIGGYLVGQHKTKTVEKVVYKVMQINEEELLDPVSPNDQYLYRKFEEEAAKHGFREEEE
jgi:pyridoxal/pyridoxine/pyridoxamine kinase